MNAEMPRIWRAEKSLADHYETITANAVYTDAVLADIARQGFNAIWVHGLLRGMVPSRVFPELGKNAAEHIQNMRELIPRAERHGIKVYIYLQPPRGLPADDPFWKKHPEAGGRCYKVMDPRQEIRCFCTSSPEVKNYLQDSSQRIFAELPELAGLILITASEFPAHCYSHYSFLRYQDNPKEAEPLGCPRCEKRHPAEVVTEIIQLIRDGVREVSKAAGIIVWNWSWNMYEPNPCPTIINALPDDVIFMAGFERGGRKKILGKMREVDEYSLSYAGPSPTFRQCLELARKRGLPVMAKLQIGTTHELATVPNLPLIGNLYEKVRALKELEVAGFMGCWNFGCASSANPAAFNRFWQAATLPPKEEALVEFAADYFPGCDAEKVVEAWEQFAAAMDSYPFCIAFMYLGPNNYSLAYPVRPSQAKKTPLGPSWIDLKRGEWVESNWLDGFTWPEVRKGLGQLARDWQKGAALLTKALKGSSSEHARQELDNAWICYHVFRSTWNTYRIFNLRKNWAESKLDAYLKIIRNELANLEQALPIAERDKRFGWHGECHAYMFDAPGIKKKVATLTRQLQESSSPDA